MKTANLEADSTKLRTLLEPWVQHFESPEFIDDDPVSIPHAYDDPRDQEIIGWFTALLSWGRRETILKKMAEFSERLDYRPYQFVRRFTVAQDGDKLEGFKHRTFTSGDAIALTRSLSAVIQIHGSLEAFFETCLPERADHVGEAIQQASTRLMQIVPDVPARLQKHLARPDSGSACKRINMFLRWMVRSGPVDLGIWKRITPSQLLLPLDVHSGRQARNLGILTRRQNDWKATIELTQACCQLNPDDPARYDFVFFGSGAAGIELTLEAIKKTPTAYDATGVSPSST